MSFIGDLFGSGDASDAATEAAATESAGMVEAAEIGAQSQLGAAAIAAGSQEDALRYLKETEAIPQQFREGGLTALGGLYGLEGGTGSQQELIDQAIASPLYQALMSGQEAGEESILANASATGGLRSGNVQSALYDYNSQLQNQALLESYNQQLSGLSGLAGISSNSSEIADMISGIGSTTAAGMAGAGATTAAGLASSTATTAAGMTAAAQSEEDANQQAIDNLLAIAENFVFSDRRLKKNLKKKGTVKGFNWYEWDWNTVAQKMGLKGSSEGVIADEVIGTRPDAVGMANYFMVVNYEKLGIFKETCHD